MLQLKDLKVGDTIIADAGFTCMEAGPKIVKVHEDGELFVDCDANCGHALIGQENEDGYLIGFSK